MKISMILFMLMSSMNLFAWELRYSEKGPSMDRAIKIRDEIVMHSEFSSMTTGGGITACEEKTGTPFYDLSEDQKRVSLFVNCATIYTSHDADEEILLERFPRNKKYKGVFVDVKNIGIVRPQ